MITAKSIDGTVTYTTWADEDPELEDMAEPTIEHELGLHEIEFNVKHAGKSEDGRVLFIWALPLDYVEDPHWNSLPENLIALPAEDLGDYVPHAGEYIKFYVNSNPGIMIMKAADGRLFNVSTPKSKHEKNNNGPTITHSKAKRTIERIREIEKTYRNISKA